MRQGLFPGALALTATLLIGAATAQAAYEAVEVKDGGAITGEVSFSGTPPKLDPIKVTKNPEYCGQTMANEALIVSGGKVKNVIVSLEGITKGKKATPTAAVIDNTKCHFEPHVQAATVGSKIEVKNSDPILHNTHTYLGGKETVFNVALPIKGQKVSKDLKKPGLVNAKCDAGHTWMAAYVLVSEHPYVAVTDDKGAFSIRDVPPGKYTLKVWHETLGEATKEVTVTAKGSATVSFSSADMKK